MNKYVLFTKNYNNLFIYRSILGLGNYDINVIITALHMKDCEAVWFDKRKYKHVKHWKHDNSFRFTLFQGPLLHRYLKNSWFYSERSIKLQNWIC